MGEAVISAHLAAGRSHVEIEVKFTVVLPARRTSVVHFDRINMPAENAILSLISCLSGASSTLIIRSLNRIAKRTEPQANDWVNKMVPRFINPFKNF
jgi:poly-beta-hydroxyalkanoate depolymerase